MPLTARSRLLALGLAALAGPAWAGPAASFRNGGSGRFEGVTLPESWSRDGACWVASMPARSNASPVVVGDLVCALAEPTTLTCVDAATGAVRWSAENGVGDTLSGADRSAWDARRASWRARADELDALRATYSAGRRELRRTPDDVALAARLQDASDRIVALEREVAAEAPAFDTPPVRESVGYASHSPITDGSRIYALFGHGVVSAFTREGRRVWSRWLGPTDAPLRGYHVGTAATPVLADGLLLVPYNHLTALDPGTGRTVWVGPPWRDFGTPAVARVGGTTVVATPAGELVRLVDGVVLQDDLPSVWFTGPLVDGDRLVIAGGRVSHDRAEEGPAVSVWQLREVAPGQVRAERGAHAALPPHERFYSAPVRAGEAWYALAFDGRLFRVPVATGAPVEVGVVTSSTAYASPQVVGGRLVVLGEDGQVALLDPQDGRETGSGRLAPGWSTPVFAGSRAYVRTHDALWCLGGGR